MYNRTMFSERLKELRASTGKTQKEFAEFVESTPATISAYENGTKNPSLDIVSNIAQKCEVSLDWLCGLDNNLIPKIQTYSDAIKILFALDNAGLKLTLSNCEDNPDYEECDRIVFGDKEIKDFFVEWSKMGFLRSKNMIDDDLYNLWMEKACKKNDKKIQED